MGRREERKAEGFLRPPLNPRAKVSSGSDRPSRNRPRGCSDPPATAAGERDRRNPRGERASHRRTGKKGRRWSTRRRPPDRGATSTTTRRSSRSAARRAPPRAGSSNGAFMSSVALTTFSIFQYFCRFTGSRWISRPPAANALSSSGSEVLILLPLNLLPFLHSLVSPHHFGVV